jgi:hypothetical protein
LFLIRQLLRYNIPTVSSFFHHPLELLTPSLDLPKRHLQGPYLLLGVLQSIVEVLLTIAEVYKN